MPGTVYYREAGEYTFKVPSTDTSVTITTWGAGRGADFQFAGQQAVHAVEGGETLYVHVGGVPTVSGGGYNGGGTGVVLSGLDPNGSGDIITSHGHGASDVRQGGNGYEHRIQVSGGQGGGSVENFVWPPWLINNWGGPGYGEDPLQTLALYSGDIISYPLTSSTTSTPVGASQGTGIYFIDTGFDTERVEGTLYAGAGGGGYVGGDSGFVWITTLPYRFLDYSTGIGYPATFDTRGYDGSSWCATTPIATGLSILAYAEHSAIPYQGGVDISYEGELEDLFEGWSTGSVRVGTEWGW